MNDPAGFGRHAPGRLVARLLNLTRDCRPDWRGKRCAFVLRALAIRLLRGRPLDVETFGARMRLYPYNNTCEKRLLFTPQYFDPAERDLLARHIHPDFTFIDIGANIGGYTLFTAAAAGPRARILAIEPHPDVFERLATNIRLNGFANVKALDCAVADRGGEITLFLDAANLGGTSMKIVHADGFGERLRVRARTLAGIIRDEGIAHVDAIKLDTEGAADLILEPFFRDAGSDLWPRLILMENTGGRWSIDIETILRDCGYRETLRTFANVAYERPLATADSPG